MYTVCIPTNCDETKLISLRFTIRALKAQSIPPGEIILSTNALDVENFVEQILECFPDLKIIDSSSMIGNVSFARNIAAENSRFDHILFVDDDTVAGQLHNMKQILNNIEAFDFACGAKRLWAPANWQKDIPEIDPISHSMTILNETSLEPININRRNNKQRLSNYSFIGNFGIISKKAWDICGGFDELFEGWGYEDADLMQELLHRNQRFFLLNTIPITCYHLSHYTDKSNVNNNINRYEKKCRERGQTFKLNHLFGVFENDGFHLSSKI